MTSPFFGYPGGLYRIEPRYPGYSTGATFFVDGAPPAAMHDPLTVGSAWTALPGELIGPSAEHEPPATPLKPDESTVMFTTLVPGVNPVIDAGLREFAAGRYAQARSVFESASVAAPDDPYAAILCSVACFAEGDYAKAHEALGAVFASRPELMARPLDLAAIYPDPALAQEHLTALAAFVDAHPEDAGARFLLAYVLFVFEAPEAALQTLTSPGSTSAQDQASISLRVLLERMLRSADR